MTELQRDERSVVSSLGTDVIRRSIAELENARVGYQAQIQHATDQLDFADRELRLLRELLKMREGASSEPKPDGLLIGPNDKRAGAAAPTSIAPQGVVEEVVSILAEAGEPLPIRIIFDRLRQKQVALPGQGRMVNVIAAITRADAIVRPARGVYALTGWGMTDGQNQAPHRARRSKGRKGKTKAGGR
jgi:hypothetical protein